MCIPVPPYWDLEVGEADLSRRKLEYRMVGLSFREYLAISYGYHLPVYSLEDILKHKVDFPYAEARPILLFKEYLQHGYYPSFRKRDICFVYKVSLSRLWKMIYRLLRIIEYSNSIEIEKTVVYYSEKCSV